MYFKVNWHSFISVFTGLFVMTILPISADAADKPSYNKSVSDRLSALRQFAEQNPGPAPLERVNGCLALLQQEIAAPSASRYGGVAGPSDSGNVRAAIIQSICTPSQKGAERDQIRSIVKEKLAQNPADDQYMHDVLTLVIAFTGDKSVLPGVMQILTTHKDGYMRMIAANALYDIAGPAEIPALKQVLHSDTYAKVRLGFDSSKMVYSPVRVAVADVLRGRLKQQVERDAEVLPACYGVKAIEPLLYVDDSATAEQTIEYLRGIGGSESQDALRRFVAMKADSPPFEKRVKHAQDALSALGANTTK